MSKTNQVIKNARKVAIKKVNKTPLKRVKSVTDDYGNRVRVLKKPSGQIVQRNAGGLYGAKQKLRKLANKKPNVNNGGIKQTRHKNSIIRREKLNKPGNKLKYHRTANDLAASKRNFEANAPVKRSAIRHKMSKIDLKRERGK